MTLVYNYSYVEIILTVKTQFLWSITLLWMIKLYFQSNKLTQNKSEVLQFASDSYTQFTFNRPSIDVIEQIYQSKTEIND